MNRTVMITGAAGGLGRAVTGLLAERGWTLALVSREAARLEGLGGEEPLRIEGDVSTHEGAEVAVKTCIDAWSAPPAALAHCAGAVLIQSLHGTSEAQYRDCMRANMDSAFFTLKAYVNALMKAKTEGAACLVSTVAAQIGINRHEAVAAAKAGIEGLVRSAAASYAARGIRVNAIAPGLMRTPATERFFGDEKMVKQLDAQYPLGRHGLAGDGAAAMAWLLSDEASWITGQVLPVDGGFTSVRPMVRG